MNPGVKSILVNLNEKKLSSHDANSSIMEAGEIDNELVNEATINQFTESAFGVSVLREKLEIYKSNRIL